VNFELILDAVSSQPLPILATVLAISAAFLMGFARSALGAGGFVVSPMMVLALGGSNGLAVVAVLMLPASILGVWQHRKESNPSLSKPLLPGAVFGTAIGAAILWLLVSDGAMALIHRRLELVVAGLSLLYVALIMLRERVAKQFAAKGAPTAGGLFALGSAIGISQTVANSGAPLMTVFFLCYKITRQQFVAAQNKFLLVQNFTKIIPLVLLGILHFGNAGAAIILLPLTFVGSWLGRKFYNSASEKIYFICYSALLVLGFVASVVLIIGRERVFAWL
jgi:uncharacterized membrane protein YfcA